jgi:hypothetical protein
MGYIEILLGSNGIHNQQSDMGLAENGWYTHKMAW